MIPVTVFKGRRVALFGLGLSGLAAARALKAGGAEVVAWDDNEASREAALKDDIPVADLREADWDSFAALLLAPGVPLTHPAPHWTVEKARTANVEIIGDTELFFRQRAKQGSQARVIAITGTNGKSTTSALTAHVLREAGLRAELGGNIGTAILDLAPLDDANVYVIEFSSYQIDLTPSLSATGAALLNITPDHLDRHGTIENYAGVKARIFDRMESGGTAVVGVDDGYCRAIADALPGPYSICRISVDGRVENGVFARDGDLIEMRDGVEQPPVSLAGIVALRGAHNAQNAAATLALARGLGLEREVVQKAFASFPGLEHRMQQVGTLGRVLFINDSKGTNADAAAHALASFETIYWIAGGLAKAGGIESLEGYFPRIRRAYLIGDAAEQFARTLEGKVDYVVSGTLDKAVSQAARDAGQSDEKEPAVLLSPACASFDQYRSFMARGDAFRDAVAGLSGVTLNPGVAA